MLLHPPPHTYTKNKLEVKKSFYEINSMLIFFPRLWLFLDINNKLNKPKIIHGQCSYMRNILYKKYEI